MIGIVDYGLGNVQAFANIYKRLGVPCRIAQTPEELSKATRIILPGVGSFDWAMEKLEKSGMRMTLDEMVLDKGVSVLGVCVGMQIMAEKSDEGQLEGFGWIPGIVKKIPINNDSKPSLPHMGWNSITHDNDAIFKKIDSSLGFYFLHSYYFDVKDKSHAIASTNYYKDLTCTVKNKNIIGTQFHPEKSHSNGAQIFKNFACLT